MPGTRNKNFFNIILILLIVCGALLLNGNSGVVKAGTDEVYKNIEVFIEVLRQIDTSRGFLTDHAPRQSSVSTGKTVFGIAVK